MSIHKVKEEFCKYLLLYSRGIDVPNSKKTYHFEVSSLLLTTGRTQKQVTKNFRFLYKFKYKFPCQNTFKGKWGDSGRDYKYLNCFFRFF